MRKLARALALTAALAGLTAGAVTLAAAQDAKKPAKEEKKTGSVEIYKAKDGFRIRIKNADGKNLATSAKAQPTKDDALKVLDEIKDALATKPVDVR